MHMHKNKLCKPFDNGLFIWKILDNKKSLTRRSNGHIQMCVEPIP